IGSAPLFSYKEKEFNIFSGSLEPLKNLKKLKFLNIETTDLHNNDDSLRYLTALKEINCLSSINSRKCLEISKQVRFNDLDVYRSSKYFLDNNEDINAGDHKFETSFSKLEKKVRRNFAQNGVIFHEGFKLASTKVDYEKEKNRILTERGQEYQNKINELMTDNNKKEKSFKEIRSFFEQASTEDGIDVYKVFRNKEQKIEDIKEENSLHIKNVEELDYESFKLANDFNFLSLENERQREITQLGIDRK